jgi:ubiquitin-protein ligase
LKELMDLSKAPIPGVAIELENSEVTKWIVIIDGPEGTPFVGGKFRVSLDFSDSYPFKYPKINVKTKIYHPNVSNTGDICTLALDQVWVPTLNAKYIIEFLLTIIQSPNSENFLDQEIGGVYSSNKTAWAAKAAEWTAMYAK